MHFHCIKVLTLILSYTILTNGNFAEQFLDLMFQKRISRQISEKAIFTGLEKYVAAMDVESFAGDYYLVQFFDYINGITSFHHVDPIRQEYGVYNTDFNKDKTPAQDVFILKKNEDRIKNVKDKRTYVILRRTKPESKLFYVSYVYLKEPHNPPLSQVMEFGSDKFEIEWDLWDHKGGKEYKSQIFGQVNCRATIFVPCRADETKNFPLATFGSNSITPKSGKEELNFVAGKISLPDNGDVDEDIDFFYDLDDDTSDSRYIGSKIYTLTTTALDKKSGRVVAQSSKNATQKNQRSIVGSFVNMGVNVANAFIKVGFGLVKNFGGLFGGLGTSKASWHSVAPEVGINEEGAERWLDDNEMSELVAEVRLDTSGGLGGAINPNEDKERPEEVSEVVFQAGRGLLDFLPENEKDPMPNDVVEKVVDAVLMDNTDSFIHPGWKTLGMKIEDKVTLQREDQTFVGFSPCAYKQVAVDKIKNAKSPEILVTSILQALGTYCIKGQSEMISNLFAEGFLERKDKNYFQVPSDFKLLNNPKLNTDSTLKLLQAFEWAVFSEVYETEASTPAKSLTAPDGSKLSRSVFTLGNYVMKVIETYRSSKIRAHCVKLRRSLAKTLKSVLIKLIQDKIILQRCDKCSEDKAINYNDSVYVVGLMQFIFRGLASTRHGGDLDKTFETFYITNRSVFEGKVKSYYT